MKGLPVRFPSPARGLREKRFGYPTSFGRPRRWGAHAESHDENHHDEIPTDVLLAGVGKRHNRPSRILVSTAAAAKFVTKYVRDKICCFNSLPLCRAGSSG